jgi:hypothetical protein
METQEPKQAYEKVMSVIYFINSLKIDGKILISEKVKNFTQLNKLTRKLFSSSLAEIKSDSEADNTKPFHAVTVSLEEFVINEKNITEFIELINFADNVIIYGDESDKFNISFYIEGIWEE